ncbi:hypothetical protein HN51_067237 [Arachis hypogaea]
MKNSIRGCISCILPYGALDVIRIVHSNDRIKLHLLLQNARRFSLIASPSSSPRKWSIRGCISCILPCGALDVIRIVYSNGRIEELTTRTINAADVMRAHPNYILKKYSPSNLLIVPPHADFHRGNIYFLIPLPPPPNQHATAVDQHLSTSTHTSISCRLTLWRSHLDTISENRDKLIEEQ